MPVTYGIVNQVSDTALYVLGFWSGVAVRHPIRQAAGSQGETNRVFMLDHNVSRILAGKHVTQ